MPIVKQTGDRRIRRRTLTAAVVGLVWLVVSVDSLAAQSALQWSRLERERFDALPPVAVATDSTWPPMEYINRAGELVGFDIDLMREIGRRAGFRPVFETVTWDGIFAGLAAGAYDVIASSVTLLPERARVMRFSRPYLEAAQYLVVSAERADVETLDDLAGGEVGAQIGTTGAIVVGATPGVTLQTYDDLGLAVEELALGRLDGIVADVAIVQAFVLANERYGALLRVAGEPYAVESYAFATRMDLPELAARIDRGLASVRADGTLAELRAFWFPDVTW